MRDIETSTEDPSLDSAAPKKRQKRHHGDEEAANSQNGRQNKACANCRKLKVKCDSPDSPESSNNACSRCQRLGLRCLREKKSWTSAEDGAWQTQLTLTKLERALEDVLERLDMPALDLYVSPAIVRPRHPPRATRPNSEERGDDVRDVSPDPINSLIEATQLNGLKSQLRSVKLRRKGGMRRKDHDMISENLMGADEAEELLGLFKEMQSHHLFSASIPHDASVESIRASSTVLFTAIMLVTALHIPGRESLHETCHGVFMGLVSSVMFDRFHTLDDIRGLCIAAFWQPYLSWKLSGLSIRMATELNLHHAFYEAFNDPDTTEDQRKESLEKARLWYLLFILDHQSSITYGRPSIMSELRPIKDYEMLLNSMHCTYADQELIAQVTGLVLLSRAFDFFGLEPKRTMSGDDASTMNHMRFTEDIRAWRDRWLMHCRSLNSSTGSIGRSVELQYKFSNLVLNSLVLRGRPLEKISEMPTSLRPLALKAVEAAHSILQHFLAEPKYFEEIVGMPLYLHSMIAFAVVFLMKMAQRWHAIGITIDAAQRTIPLVERIIHMLRSCKAGANHMVFSMATGFDRMLRQMRRNNQHLQSRMEMSAQDQSIDRNGSRFSLDLSSEGPIQSQLQSDYDLGMPSIAANNLLPASQVSPETAGSQGLFANWGFQDENLWSVGMGYDLLDPGGQGLATTDFPFDMSSW